MTEYPPCERCHYKVYTDSEIKAWVSIKGKYYHNDCIETALLQADKYVKMDDIVNDKDRMLTVKVDTDVWQCGRCMRYTGGYSPGSCRYCGSHLGYDSSENPKARLTRTCQMT